MSYNKPKRILPVKLVDNLNDVIKLLQEEYDDLHERYDDDKKDYIKRIEKCTEGGYIEKEINHYLRYGYGFPSKKKESE